MAWRVITYRLPAEPSRHRVAVWRELRRLGAVPLQQGTWAVPGGEPFEAGFAQVVEAITAAGGQPVVLAVADDQASSEQLTSVQGNRWQHPRLPSYPDQPGPGGITDAGPPVPPFAHTVHVTHATNPMVTPRRYGWHAADRLSLCTGPGERIWPRPFEDPQ